MLDAADSQARQGTDPANKMDALAALNEKRRG
jgi:hypothetical protein